MNNKIFRIILMFLAVCISSISTLFAVSFGLSNVTLDHDNQDLTQENEELNDAVSDLQNTINMDPASAVVSYEVDGKIWKIDVTKKGTSVYLPTAPDTDTHAFDGWKIDGVGDKMTGDTTIKENTKFVANMVEKDWLVESFGGLASFNGNYIWTDGENTYYSNYDKQYILNKQTNFWEKITWTGLTSLVEGRYIWTDGENTYYSNGSSHYVLKDDNTWEKMTWQGNSSFYGYYVWSNGVNVYLGNEYVLNGNTWEPINWVNAVNNMIRDDIWTDGEKYYYSDRDSSTHYEIDFENKEWKEKTWEYQPSYLAGNRIWTDGTATYFSNGTSQYILDKTANTWKEYEWQNVDLLNFFGEYVYKIDDVIYHSYNKYQYKLVDGQWQNMIWGGLANFNPNNNQVWSDGINIYYSNNNEQAVYDVATKSWLPMAWQGELTSFSGYYVWSDGENFYFKDKYILNKATQTWEAVDMTINGSMGGLWYDVWTDGNNCYYSYNSNQFIFDKTTKTWNEFTSWKGLTSFRGEYIWTDGENTYYSSYSEQYVLKEDYTWEKMTWQGNSSFYGYHVWSDGENIYCSNSSTQYVLDQATKTWTKKTWYGYQYISANQVWTDGTNIYYSNGSDHYILNRNKNA